MVRQQYMYGDPSSNIWRQAVDAVKQEVVQSGGASLQALCECLDRFPGVPGLDLDALAQDLAFLGQQLQALSSQTNTAAEAAAVSEQHPQQQQLQKQSHALADVLHACVRFCKAVTGVLSTVQQAGEPQRQNSRWQHSHRHRQQQQQPAPQQQLLPAAAATALCSCLRQWSDPLLLPALQHHSCQADCDLPQAAVVALGALLPSQLHAVSAHERAAVLVLLLALAQPPPHAHSNPTTGAVVGNSSVHTSADASGTGQGRQQQQQGKQESQHWALACTAVVALSDTMSEALRSSSVAAAAPAGSSGKQATGGGAAGLQPEEAANITAGLVEALSTSCGVRGSVGSSSRIGSTGGAAGHLNSSTRTGSSGGSSGAAEHHSSSGSSRQQPVESVVHSQYYASLLVALSHAVNSNTQGWQGCAGAVTECARKLFTYGTQQQQHLQMQQPASSPAAFTAATAASHASPAAAAQSAAAVSQLPVKHKYVPPHARAATAAQSPSKPSQDKQQQQLQDSSDESEQSASDWSDVSDTECFQGRGGRRSSNSRERSQLKQQQQQLHDPINAVRVRSALLQLLQVLIQADPRALHPYWAALLPGQAPLQRSPLSPHLLTVLLYDPSDKVRLLAVGVLGVLLEGPPARALLAVAEAKTAQPPIRGFVTMSVSLGHMLLSLHTGLLALVTAWQQQKLQQQQPQCQQQQGVLPVPAVLLSAVLRVLCALVPVTPYERLPSALLTDVVDRMWQLWQQLQPPASSAPLGDSTPAAAAAGHGGAGSVVPRLHLSEAAAAPAAGSPVTPMRTSSSSSSGGGMLIAAVAVLAQAFATKKPLPALGRWLGGATSSSSRGHLLISCLLTAARAHECMVRIEALAALRGCCINYPAAIPAQHSQTVAEPSGPSSSAAAAVSAHDRPGASACSSSRRGGNGGIDCWQQLLAVVEVSVAAAAQPSSARNTPRSSPRVSTTADSPAAAAAAAGGSGSTSPEVKAGQHAVRLLGDWLSAVAAAEGEAAARGQQQQKQLDLTDLAVAWAHVLQLLLSDGVWHHPSPVICSAAAAVCGMVPAQVWLMVPVQLRQQLLAAAGVTAARADVTAVRAAACKLLGSCAVMPGVLGQQQESGPAQLQSAQQQQQQQQQQHGCGAEQLQRAQQQKQQQQQHGSEAEQLQRAQQQQHQQHGADAEQLQWVHQQCVGQEQRLLQSLAQCVSDEAVSVRLSAAWALANVCDELRRQLDNIAQPCSIRGPGRVEPQPHLQQQQGGPVMSPAVLRVVCDAAVAAAGDTEKVRAHGVRAVGALLAAWQPSWGLGSATSSSNSTASAPGSTSNGVLPATPAKAGWSWVPVWFRAAMSALQSCLAARSMKVVWNAACAAAADLQNSVILTVPVVADSTPGLLRMLVVLVRDSSNFKIKTHAAAALAAPLDRGAYGEVFADGLLVLLAALQGLQGSSSVQPLPVAARDAGGAGAAAQQAAGGSGADSADEESAFPNYRYIPGLQAQLESSLCHLLALLQPSDTTRLGEQLKRNQQLLLTAMARCAESAAAQARQQQMSADVRAVVTGGTAGSDVSVDAGSGLLAACVPGGSRQQHGGGQAARQPVVQPALPADPFGQGVVLSTDRSAVAGGKGSAGVRAACSTATGAAGGGPSKAGALEWGAGVVSKIESGKQGRSGHQCGVDMVADVGCGQTAMSVSATVQAALGGLTRVLGPAVLDAWAAQQACT